jgi:uncharacterized protein with ATP-grasp and redox domains
MKQGERGNRYLKAILTQCANAIGKSTKNSRLVAKFKSIKVRRGHNKAIIAVCRAILTAIYHMLSKNEPYKDYQDSAVRKALSVHQVSEQVLVEQLLALGYSVEKVLRN